MPPDEHRQVEFDRLNLFGKGVFVAGSAFRMAIGLIDSTVETIGTIWSEAEKAFAEGRDPNMDEAKILDERNRSEDPVSSER